jgi:hypothetical protein
MTGEIQTDDGAQGEREDLAELEVIVEVRDCGGFAGGLLESLIWIRRLPVFVITFDG